MTVQASPGLTVSDDAIVGTSVTAAMISDGVVGVMETIAFRIVTAQGRTDERTITLRIADR